MALVLVSKDSDGNPIVIGPFKDKAEIVEHNRRNPNSTSKSARVASLIASANRDKK